MERRELDRARLTTARLAASLAVLALLAAAAVAIGLLVGSVPIDPRAALADATARTILLEIRLPRVLLAAVVGGALAASGAALQPTLRNPLASPDIIGVSGGAALAAVGALAVLPRTSAFDGFVPLIAFVGAAVSSMLVYRLSLVRGRLEPYTQILVGVIFNTFAAAVILMISALVDLTRSHSIVFWMMGALSVPPYPVLVLVSIACALGAAVLLREAPRLNVLSLGDESAELLGVDLARCRRRVFGASALLVGTVVSLTGIITFVGLIVPHVLRRLLGGDNRLLVPASLFAGAVFLVLCDALARAAAAPKELPVGAITAMTGGPFFIYLLRRRVRAEAGP